MSELKKEIVLIGIGEIGGVIAKGFLRQGYTLHPITREMDIEQRAAQIPEPTLVVVAVGEKDLPSVLEKMPAPWKQCLCLLQNELLPEDWTDIPDPTVISIWFEKKPGMTPKVIIPSPVFGPNAEILSKALAAVDIPTKQLQDKNQLLFELVLKNLYILTTNIAGLKTGGSVGELWQSHKPFAESVAREIILLQQAMTNRSFDEEALIESMLTAFDGDPDHKCMGRSAPLRLQRALNHADRLKLELPQLRQLEQLQSAN